MYVHMYIYSPSIYKFLNNPDTVRGLNTHSVFNWFNFVDGRKEDSINPNQLRDPFERKERVLFESHTRRDVNYPGLH